LVEIFINSFSSSSSSDEDGEAIDDERESGDGQEEQESESSTKKKVDHDEDRSNPQYIPKKGTFYEHDDRMAEDIDEEAKPENPENTTNSTEALCGVLSSTLSNSKINPKLVKKAAKEVDRWSHDRFNENEQAPKSRSELVSAYGYDIRTEDCAPRSRRQRRYGRHQPKYDRNWEDEEAYRKNQAKAKTARKPPRPEDFPALGSTRQSSERSRGGEQTRKVRSNRPPQDENDPSNYNRSPVRSYREKRGSRDDRNQREPRRYNNDNSNSNNSRNVKGKKNINFNHNIEFKNQNRKNINYESSQAKKNNVLNQQIQSSSSQQSPGQTNSSHHQPSTSNGQRFNNETQVGSMSFTNSKMNNATNSNPPSTSRAILNYDNSSGNYGRGSREKEVNQQQQQQQASMSPSKNLQQYSDHQHEQLKLMEKGYREQSKSTNLTMNQQVPMNNMQQEVQMMNNAEMSRAKRYSSIHQRSNLNESTQSQQTSQQAQPTQPPQQQQQPVAYQQYQEIDPTQISPAYISAQQTPQPTTQPPQQQPTQQQKYQINQQTAAYYTNPSNDFAAQQASLMNAMVEKYQYQQQTPSVQYISPQQAQQIYQPQQQQQPIYVPTQAAAPTYTQYTGYQNYNLQATPNAAPQPQQPTPAPAQPIYQTQSGLTYFPNAPMTQAHPQRIIQPQRRPPNPIPILAPPDHKKSHGDDDKTEGGETTGEIDHILDNMFVQRQPYEPTISLKDPPAMSTNDGDKVDQDQISDGMNVRINILFI
jgi:protein CASC3